jgi:Zinc carboxypeptidase
VTDRSVLIAIGPIRLTDTRGAGSGFSPIDSQSIRVDVLGRAGVPDTAVAAVVSVVAVRPRRDGYLSVYPARTARPTISTVNFLAGQEISNTAIVPLGDGGIDLWSSDPDAEFVVDITGVFVPAADAARAGRLVPSESVRLVDTRSSRPLAAGATMRVPLPSGLATDTQALAVNLTVADATAPGFWSARPAGTAAQVSSTVNIDRAGQTRARFAIVPVTEQGFDVFSQSGGHLIVDIVGSFTGPSAPQSPFGLFVAAGPERVLDTRQRTTAPALSIFPGGTIEFSPGTVSAAAVAMNVTTADANAASFLTAWAAGTAKPGTSTVNAPGPALAAANFAITAMSERGIALHSQTGEDAIVDLAGWFTGEPLGDPVPPLGNKPAPGRAASMLIGSSAGGRPIVVTRRRGSAATKRTVVVVGSVHGEEPEGKRVAQQLLTATLPADLDLWIIPALNPDGDATRKRGNLNGVDLNRNFPTNWAAEGGPTTSGVHDPGPSPASEPETRAMMTFLATVRPDYTVWFHQPLDIVDCNIARVGSACLAFADAVDLNVGFQELSGTATDWTMTNGFGKAFVVEFGFGSQTAATISRHTNAVLNLGLLS